MAQTKRKRNSTSAKSNKKAKTISSSASEAATETEAGPLWDALCILNEKGPEGARQYLIEWIGIDPETGRAWRPTWEPEENANEALVAAWEEEKARIKTRAGGDSGRGRPAQRQHTQSPRRIRCSRVIESSPEPLTRSSSPSAPSTGARNSAGPPDQASSTVVTSPVGTRTPPSGRVSPRIHIAPRGDSLEREEYEWFSQLGTSNSDSAHTHTQGTHLDSSRLFAAAPYSTGIVPDFQSSVGERSFIPITQQTEGTAQQDGSQTGEDITEDSGLLDIIQDASPARSIPETIPDTNAADSQSQNLRGIQGTLQFIESSSQAVDQDEGTRIEQEEQGRGATQRADLAEASVAPVNQTDLSNQNTADSNPNTVTGTGASQVGASPQVGVCSQASLAESSEPDEAGQFPFQSQHRLHQFTQEAITSTQHLTSAETGDSAASATISNQADSATAQQVAHQLPPSLLEQPALTKENDLPLLQEFDRSLPVVEQEPALQESISNVSAQSAQAVQSCHSPSPRSTAHSTQGQQQNAQIVPTETDLSFQEDTTGSLRLTIEHSVRRGSSESRHDSSQETPERSRPSKSAQTSSSPIPYPPSQSLGTQYSKAPPRPGTPAPTSSLSIMDSADDIQRKLQEAIAKKQLENPYTPKRRPNRSSLTPAKTPSNVPVAAPASASSLLRTTENLEGTRSPSVVPDRLPAAQAPTSLRTVASVSNAPRPASPQAETVPSLSAAQAEPVEVEVVIAAEPTATINSHDSADSDAMEISPPDNSDTESLLNDDLLLAEREFIVPLSMHGKQKDWYSLHIAGKKALLQEFLDDPRSINPLSEIEKIVEDLRDLETHMDLVFAEAKSSYTDQELSASQAENTAGWAVENSTKFRFLHTLFNDLRDSVSQKHIVLVVEKDNDALFNILETFCKGKYVNYSMPTKGRQADPAGVEGNLLVSILPSHASPIIRAPDLIVCLDGVQDATQIRKKNWARASAGGFVPVIHLVIPRTVGHIERFISPGLDLRDRLHTVLAGLAQVHSRSEIGQAIDEKTPRDTKCAAMTANWLMQCADGEEEMEWPLPSIGGVKDVIEYQTQRSPTSTNSPAPERVKRPLENEDLDPSKRRRFTPQPQSVTSSGANNEHETTHISDSMPGTAAAEERNLQQRLARAEEAYHKERQARKEQERRFVEQKEMWEKQQTVHEDLTRDHRLLLGKQQATETKVETLTKNNATLTDRLAARTTELRELEKQLQEQRSTHLLSPDEQVAEITRLRAQLAEAQTAKERALKSVSTTENTLEYTKEAYRASQDVASKATTRVSELESTTEKLSLAASGQAAKLKVMHFDRTHDLQQQQIKTLNAELLVLKTALRNKDDEVVRLRSVAQRPGVGTRGASATPQPKIRSRAASPSLAGGRISNLRNG